MKILKSQEYQFAGITDDGLLIFEKVGTHEYVVVNAAKLVSKNDATRYYTFVDPSTISVGS